MPNTYFQIGPFPASIEKEIHDYLESKGAVLLITTSNISKTYAYRTKVNVYWHPDFGIAVEYEPNLREMINSVKIDSLGNGKYPENMERELTDIVSKSKQKSS